MKFLSGFAAYEDVPDPKILDRLNMRELGNLIWQAGLREIATACRGIESIERLAVFLKNFDEDNARELGLQIADMADITIERVRVAERRIEEVFGKYSDSEERIRRVGLLVFAEALSIRPPVSIRYTAQKLPSSIGDDLTEMAMDPGEQQEEIARQTLRETEDLALRMSGGLKDEG